MTNDASFTMMLRRLAGMPEPARGAVLNALEEHEREALRIHIARAGGTAISTGLAQIIERCRDNASPPILTRRAAEALLAIAEEAADHEAIEVALERLRPQRAFRLGLLRRRPATS